MDEKRIRIAENNFKRYLDDGKIKQISNFNSLIYETYLRNLKGFASEYFIIIDFQAIIQFLKSLSSMIGTILSGLSDSLNSFKTSPNVISMPHLFVLKIRLATARLSELQYGQS